MRQYLSPCRLDPTGILGNHRPTVPAKKGPMMFSAIRDAVVGFVRAPRFFVTVVLTMGLAMGGLGAVGNLLYSVVFRPLNVPEPSRLAAFYAGIGEGVMGIAPATLAELNRTQEVFEGLCGIERGTFSVELNGALSRHLWEGVQGTCAQTIGIRPSLGRLIGPEDAPSADSPAPVVVLSYRYWQRSFASNPAVLGSTLKVNGVSFTVVGVGPVGYDGINVDAGPDLTVPFGTSAKLSGFRPLALWAVGRLRDGVTIEQALAAMRVTWPAAYAETTTVTPAQVMARAGSADVVRVVSVARGISELRIRYERSLYALAVLAVLLWGLACLNISGLFLTRTVTREMEFRIQVALGAGRGRLFAKLVAEAAVVTAAGSALALFLTSALSSFLLSAVWTNTLPSTLNVTPGATIILAAMAAWVVTMGIVSAPSIAMVALRNWTVLTGSAPTTSRTASHSRRAILTAQVSASVVLLFMATVMTHNLTQLQAIDPGFARDHVVFARLDPRPKVAPADNPTAYLRHLLERTQELPMVKATAFALSFPAAAVRHVEALTPGFRTETGAAGSEITAASDWVSPGFFEASGMALIRGRDLSWQDVAGQPDVAVVTAQMAQFLFADANPLGRRVRMPTGKLVTIVGIAGDATSGDPRIAGFPRIYLPVLQEPRRMAGGNLILRQDQPVNIRAELDAAVAGLGRQSVTFMRTANEQTDLLLARERLLAKLSSFFGALALVVVGLGLYGLLSYSVAQRRREIGVRSALGATRTRILALVVGEGLVITCLGIVAGIPLAVWARAAVSALLFKAPPVDVVAILVTIAVVALASGLASAVPARTAAKLAPSEALRHL